jgi:hypothetical protein
MPYTVTTRKRGGFEYTSVAETESAALVLAQMMRRAGDEYCDEAKVIVRERGGEVVAAWRGSSYGWQSVPLTRGATVTTPSSLPALAPRRPAASLFAHVPTDPIQEPSASLITEHSAV